MDGQPPTAAPELSIQDPLNAGCTTSLSRSAIPKTGTEAREAKEAAQVHARAGYPEKIV